ncbi:hypothetical protein [Microbacterium sp. CIAB417]|uniref:hypothetical protein n=1 Tax=Microbacterium sp. CIAB417 TaxID=2860287 RepID=UPI001FAC7AB9|nr:hypothetical protein [Microbacterium sp. CIAB417]
MANEDTGGGSFADVLRDAIVARGVTLAWLNKRLRENGNPVSMATLSYWRSGARRPEGAQSLAAVADIEDLLRLESGTLSDLVGPTQRIGPVGMPMFPLNENAIEEAVTEVFHALGAPQFDLARDVSTHSVTDVGPDGNVVSRTTRTLVQSMSGLLTHVPYVDMTPGVRTPPPVFRAIAGGRIAALHSHESGEVHGFSLELDQPVDSAQSTMIEWAFEVPPGYPPVRETGHGVARRARDLVLWTRFHPDALPDWIDEVEESPHGIVRTPVTIDAGSSVLQVRRRFGPGMLLLRWGYGERE